MNRVESIALFYQGREAWNTWAQQMLAKRKALEDEERWFEEGPDGELTSEARAWQDEATTDFSRHDFGRQVDFSAFLFPGLAQLRGVIFKDEARFEGVTFKGDAVFGGAVFEDEARFEGVTFKGDAVFGGTVFEDEARFEGAIFEDDAGFGGVIFENEAWFKGVDFKSRAWFGGATFTGEAGFDGATFEDEAWFEGAIFKYRAWFGEAVFKEEVWFVGATFKGEASFEEVKFKDEASFRICRFSSDTDFYRSCFDGYADFGAIDSVSSFSLAGAEFKLVPDFVQAHFAEAPRLDNVRIISYGFWPRLMIIVKRRLKHGGEQAGCGEWRRLFPEFDPNLPPRWQALKRLAIQGHDHENEQQFFRGELLSRRWRISWAWPMPFMAGLAYQVLGDFGRSIFRPLFWIGITILLFAALYLHQHPNFREDTFVHTVRTMPIALLSTSATTCLQCVHGNDNPVSAALDLSVRNAFLFVGQTSREKLRQDYICLYGSVFQGKNTKSASSRTQSAIPKIPHSVVFLEHLQNIVSAVLIFLLLLGLRNHFKI